MLPSRRQNSAVTLSSFTCDRLPLARASKRKPRGRKPACKTLPLPHLRRDFHPHPHTRTRAERRRCSFVMQPGFARMPLLHTSTSSPLLYTCRRGMRGASDLRSFQYSPGLPFFQKPPHYCKVTRQGGSRGVLPAPWVAPMWTRQSWSCSSSCG